MRTLKIYKEQNTKLQTTDNASLHSQQPNLLSACATDLVESEDGVDLGSLVGIAATLGPGRPQFNLVRVHAVIELEAIFEESTRDGDLL